MKQFKEIKKDLEKKFPKGVNRAYPDGEPIPRKLPAFYEKGNSKEHCGNCEHFESDDCYCDFYKAVVRHDYWCKKWIPIHSE